MSAASQGAGSGVVIGLVLVLLLQQFGSLDLSDLIPAIEYLLIGGVIGGILGGLIGWALGRSYLARHAVASTSAPK